MKPIDPHHPWHWIGLLAVLFYSGLGGLFLTLGPPFGRAPVYPTDHAQFFAFWSRVYLNEWLFAAIVLVCIWRSRAGFESIGMVRPQPRPVRFGPLGQPAPLIHVTFSPSAPSYP